MEIKTVEEGIYLNSLPDKQYIVSAFEQDLKIRNCSIRTIESYKSVIRRFLEKYPLNSGIEEFKQYLVYLRSKKRSQKTIENQFTAISTFYDFLEFEGYTVQNDVLRFRKRYLRTYKVPITESRKIISIEDMAKLIQSPEWIGDQALIILMAKTGIRRNEAINLDITDISLETNSLCLKQTAKRSNRLLFFDDETKAFLEAHLKTRKDSNPALFLGHTGKRICRDYIYELITLHSKNLGFHTPNQNRSKLSVKFTPHCLRHFFTTHIRRNGLSREFIQELRGDSIKEAIDIYNHIDPHELQAAYNKHIYQFSLTPDPNSYKKRKTPKRLVRINKNRKQGKKQRNTKSL